MQRVVDEIAFLKYIFSSHLIYILINTHVMGMRTCVCVGLSINIFSPIKWVSNENYANT